MPTEMEDFGVRNVKVGDEVSQTYVFTFDDIEVGEDPNLGRRDSFKFEAFQDGELIGLADSTRKAHSGGGQHYVNESDGELKDVRDIVGGFFNANDMEKLLVAIANGEVAGVSGVEIDRGTGTLKFVLDTRKARADGDGENDDVIVINFGENRLDALIEENDLDIPDVRPALTGTINNTNVDGADFTVTADAETGDLTVKIETPDGLTVTENVGDNYLYGNANDVGDENVRELRNGDDPTASNGEDIEFDGFGGFVTAREVQELLNEAGDTPAIFEGTDNDRNGDFDFTLQFEVVNAPEVRPALTGTINNANIDGAEFTVAADADGDLTVSIDNGVVEVSEEVGSSFLFGNANDVGDPTVRALRFDNVDAPGVPEDFGFGGFISGDDVETLVGDGGSQAFEGLVDGDNGDAFEFTLTFTDEADMIA